MEAKLANLTAMDVLIVTSDVALMRGFDYRSSTGIALFIAAKLPNKRSYMQALGRVGRYNEECTRTVAEDIGREAYHNDDEEVGIKIIEMKKKKSHVVAPPVKQDER
jgi:hypothetical protein